MQSALDKLISLANGGAIDMVIAFTRLGKTPFSEMICCTVMANFDSFPAASVEITKRDFLARLSADVMTL